TGRAPRTGPETAAPSRQPGPEPAPLAAGSLAKGPGLPRPRAASPCASSAGPSVAAVPRGTEGAGGVTGPRVLGASVCGAASLPSRAVSGLRRGLGAAGGGWAPQPCVLLLPGSAGSLFPGDESSGARAGKWDLSMTPLGSPLVLWQAYELSTLTGTQVLLLVASETGHVYTFATRKLQPMITSETGKALIQTCLNSPDSPPRSDPTTDQRMSATGFEETDLTYQVSESDSSGETKDTLKPAFTVTNLPGTTSTIQTAPTTSTSMQVSSGPSFPITNYLAPVSASLSPNAVTSANGTVLKTTGASAVTSGGLMQIPTGFTLMSGGTMAQQVPVQAIQVHQAPQQMSPSSDSSTDLTQTSSSGTVTLPATIMTSSVPTTVGGHMMYPSPHAVMYAPTSGLADGGLAVLNAFSQAPSAMQVSHSQDQAGGVPQVFLTAPSGTVQIPVSAVQLHQMAVIGQQSSSGSSLTELQVVNLDTSHGTKSE
uniref:Serum response factor n=4 Tax=Nothoprocta TaxID=8806 RepID=A0A8C6ZSF7_NOTPE